MILQISLISFLILLDLCVRRAIAWWRHIWQLYAQFEVSALMWASHSDRADCALVPTRMPGTGCALFFCFTASLSLLDVGQCWL